jgi:hypothetical protein
VEPLMQMACAYNGPAVLQGYENKAWATYAMDDFGLEAGRTYVLYDLVTGLTINRTGADLIENGLSIGLNAAESRHHFVVYEKKAAEQSMELAA